MKRIDRYLMSRFAFNFTWAMLAFWAVFLIVHLVEHLDDFIDKGAPAKFVALYYVYFSPWIIILVAPIGVLLATLFCVGFLSRRNELLAMRAAGVSLIRLSIPLLLLGLIIAGGIFVAGETIYPAAEEERQALEDQFVRKAPRPSQVMVNNLFAPGFEGRVFYFQRFNAVLGEGQNARVQEFHGGRVEQLWEFEQLEFEDSTWVGINGRSRVFAPTADSSALYASIDTMRFPGWQETPDDFIRKKVDPERVSYTTLKSTIERMRETGADTTVEETELALKLAFPSLSFLVVLIGFPIASRIKQSGMALNFGIAMGVTFVLRVLIEVFRSLGHNGDVPPMIAAWVPSIVCAVGGLLLLLRVQK